MYEFIYCFILDGKINWSAETVNSLKHQLEENEDSNLINDFIEKADRGDFITLKSGALVFRAVPAAINSDQSRKFSQELSDNDDSSSNIYEE